MEVFPHFSEEKELFGAGYPLVWYRIYPRIGCTFFKEKMFEIWGVAYTRVQEF